MFCCVEAAHGASSLSPAPARATRADHRGRGRVFLRKHEIKSAIISVLYLVLVFIQIFVQELPLSDEASQRFDQAFEYIDLTFLVFFTVEITLHILVDGFQYLLASKLYLVDAITILIFLLLSPAHGGSHGGA